MVGETSSSSTGAGSDLPTRCFRNVMTLNACLDNWQNFSHTSDTSRDIHSYLMISASFNWIALTGVI